MYDYEYEFDVLLVLRLLKLLHMRDPDALREPLEMYPKLPVDELYLIVDPIIEEFFSDLEYGIDEGFEGEVVLLSHPVINRLYSLGQRQENRYRNLNGVWRKKIKDAVEYFLIGPTNSVFDLNYHYSSGWIGIELVLSPEYYEVSLFANNLVDMLRYFEQDLQYLEGVSGTESEDELGREEAA